MKPGDRFIWLHRESDNSFGEECEIVAIRGDKVDFSYVNRPNWRSGAMPIEWVNENSYSPEEISAIRKANKRRRFAEKF